MTPPRGLSSCAFTFRPGHLLGVPGSPWVAVIFHRGGGVDRVRGGPGRDELRVQKAYDYSGGPGRDRCKVSGTWGTC
ncbi:MAG: hypothetical protein ABI720_08210 [Actinomycetes bacterium]